MHQESNGTNEIMTALVIDDDTMVCNSMATVLEMMGYAVETANDGDEALLMLAQNRYTVVLCDIIMPRMNGSALYANVAEMCPEMAQRFVFVTGWIGNRKEQDVVTRSGQPCLYKPFDINELIVALQQVGQETKIVVKKPVTTMSSANFSRI